MTPMTELHTEREAGGMTETEVLDLLAEPDNAGLRRLLVDHSASLADHGRMLEALDRRRLEIEELVDVFVPIANAAVQVASARLEALERSDLKRRAVGLRTALTNVLAAAPPSAWQIWRRSRTPEARRGMALAVETLCALGATGRQETESNGRPRGSA